MSLHMWWIFVLAVFVLSATPGPNMLHILARSVELGVRRSLAAMAGCLLAVVLVLAASAAGLSTLLLSMPGAFDAVRLLGVAYLVYVGVRTWFGGDAAIDVADRPSRPALAAGRVFRAGFAIGISNPKLLLFAAAFFPQFVDPAEPQLPQFAILVASFAVIETFWYFVYALGGRSLARFLVRPALKKAFNRFTGAIFVGFGALLLKVKPV